jgi:oligopeptide transport system permease protein
MAAFVLRRIVWTVPIVFVVVTLLFFMMRAIGGDPFRHGPLFGLSNEAWVKYGDFQPAAIRRNQREKYGLDRPWYRQYADYVRGVFTLDLGPSLSYRNLRVNDLIREVAPRSFELAFLAFGWALVVGIPLGVLAALRQDSAFDYVTRFVSSAGFALPNFLVATILIYWFAVRLGWLPTHGWTSWQHKVLPSFTLGLLPMGWVVRLVRGAMLDTLSEDYVRAARAKGLRWRRVVSLHALRNSLIPLVTVAGPLLGYLITGSFVVEQIFGVPGVGRYFVAAVLARDYPLIAGLTVMLALVIMVANLLVDVAHALLDPRVREAPQPA